MTLAVNVVAVSDRSSDSRVLAYSHSSFWTSFQAVHRCLAFENEAHSRFESQGEDGQRASEVELDAEGNLIDPNSAEGIKRKYAKAARDDERDPTKARGAPKSLFATLSVDGEGVRDELEGSLPAIVGMLSGVFEPFMGPYIAFERRNLDDLITAASRTTGSTDDDIDRDRKLPVFSTSVNIFVYIKNSIQRCTKFTTGQTFFDLHQEFKTCLRWELFVCTRMFTPAAWVHGAIRSATCVLR